MKTLYNQQYSSEFAEKCRNALEANFGEIPMPKCFGSSQKNVKVDPIYIIEVIHKTKLVNNKGINKNDKCKNTNLVIEIKTKIKL